MPLRDHFRPPISEYRRWEGFHGGWPMVIVQKLVPLLPPGFAAEPRVRLGAFYEVDIGAYEDGMPESSPFAEGGGGTATLAQPTLAPTFTGESEVSADYEYEVLVYDERDGRNLVAAIEIVSPGNKDRRDARDAFAAKTSRLLGRGICVSIVDLVTSRKFNLYEKMLRRCRLKDESLGGEPPAIYAATARTRPANRPNPHVRNFDAWFFELSVGKPLPSIPVWLDEGLRVMVDLEASYEETCKVLAIR